MLNRISNLVACLETYMYLIKANFSYPSKDLSGTKQG